MSYKTKSIVFNLESPEHRELYEFCMERCGAKRQPDGSYKGGNFSSFGLKVLALYKNWVENGKIERRQALPSTFPNLGGGSEG